VKQKNKGFSLLELMLVLALSSVLMGIAGVTFAKQRKSGTLNRSVQALGQEIKFVRSKAISSGTSWRLNLNSSSSYSTELLDSNTGQWTLKRTKNLPNGITIPIDSIGFLEFNTRGYMNLNPPTLAISLTNSEASKCIVPSMAGSIAIVDCESE